MELQIQDSRARSATAPLWLVVWRVLVAVARELVAPSTAERVRRLEVERALRRFHELDPSDTVGRVHAAQAVHVARWGDADGAPKKVPYVSITIAGRWP